MGFSFWTLHFGVYIFNCYNTHMTSSILMLGAFLLAVVAVNIAGVLYIVRLVRRGGEGAAKSGFEFLQKEIHSLRDSFDSKIGESTM